jgi:hypothetical protein
VSIEKDMSSPLLPSPQLPARHCRRLLPLAYRWYGKQGWRKKKGRWQWPARPAGSREQEQGGGKRETGNRNNGRGPTQTHSCASPTEGPTSTARARAPRPAAHISSREPCEPCSLLPAALGPGDPA